MKKFKVYKSAAGSGKTYTLVKEYLKIVLKDTGKYNRILAITFTNKAANEMKNRIIESLSEIATLKEQPEKGLAKDLLDEINIPFEQLKTNAETVLQNILHNFSDFAISTIDSFTHRIVRTFAFDLNLPLNFNIELDNEVIVDQAVDALMERIGHDEEISKILLEFTFSKLQDDKNWHIDRDLKQQAKQLQKEGVEQHLDKLKSVTIDEFASIAKLQRKENQLLKEEIKNIGKNFFNQINKQGLSESDFHQGSRGICGLFSKIEKFEGKEIPFSQTLQNIIENKQFSKPKGAQNVQIEELSPTILQWVNSFLEKQKQYISRKLFLENLYAVAVLNELNQLIEGYSRDEKVLHISEFNKRISKIVLEEPVPFLYERIGERYQHYLIDEFQDTSVLQWQNLLPLLENGLAQNHFSMIVGDSKQAIYRFRQGEVEQFEMLPEVYQKDDNPYLEEREHTLIQHYELDVLKYNFRSKRNIVEFNNELFKVVAETYLGENYKKIFLGDESKDDPGVEQLVIKEDGYVQVEFLEKEEYTENTCEKVFQSIVASLRDGYQMKDICILTRANKDLTVLSEYLSKKEINQQPISLASDESFKLNSSTKIRFIISVLEYLNQPTIQTPQLQILEYLIELKKVKQNEIIPYFQKKNIPFETFLKKAGYDITVLSAYSTSLYDTCEKIIRLFSLNEPSDIYVAAFLNSIASYAKTNEQNIGAFLQWFSENKDKLSAKSSEDLNAVHLMTIHKSKGLGYPVIIYPFADSKSNTTFDLWMETDKDVFSIPTGLITTKKEVASSCFSERFSEEKEKAMLDMVNVLYVALTRAKDRMYIYCSKPSEKEDAVNYPAMFRSFLVAKDIYSDEENKYTFGTEDKVDSKAQQTGNEKALDKLISTNWAERSISNRRNISVKEIVATELFAEKGVLLHEALANIYTLDDCENAVEKLLNKNQIQPQSKDEYLQTLNTIITHPDIRPFFDAKGTVKTESEIIQNENNYRIDRLILRENETIVIDFKTGMKRPEHYTQVNTYCDILNGMNLPNIKGYLVYINTDSPEVVAV
ncbi:UvrD-helicase domain-containing protein [Bacteroidales bacterium OttesenSCG-928-C19]|nr:UvrD-helicase domain-containing protein [Bacteroidales bacterium OttesenSCG-928-C19]